MRKSTKLKIFRRKKRSVILSVLKRHSLRQHTVIKCPQCNANIDVTKGECEYCGTKIDSVQEWEALKTEGIENRK